MLKTDIQYTTGQKQKQFRIFPLAMLRIDKIMNFEIYLWNKRKNEHVLFCGRNLRFTEAVKERLLDNGISDIYIRDSEQHAFSSYVEKNLGTILDDPGIATEQKADLLYLSLTGVIEDVMSDPRAGDVVPRSQSIVKNACKFLYEQRHALECIMRVCSFDYYTYTHSVNVFVFAMTLGTRVFPKEEVMDDYGMGALLHDVGKSQVPDEILNCKGKLTKEQFEIMKLHTWYGFEILQEKDGISPLVLDMTLHHHERIDGSGYPDGLAGDQVAREVRCVTISDIFDALTTRRSYKEQMSSFDALKLMRDEMQGHIDPELFRMFVQMISDSKKKN
jgi:HD-GYP domain-containing protein (c-di-GMP phosphodiesterase class II)